MFELANIPELAPSGFHNMMIFEYKHVLRILLTATPREATKRHVEESDVLRIWFGPLTPTAQADSIVVLKYLHEETDAELNGPLVANISFDELTNFADLNESLWGTGKRFYPVHYEHQEA